MTQKKPNVEALTILFTFEDGTSETFDLNSVPETLHSRLALHGASQKIGDSYAGAASKDDPLAFAKEAVRDTIADLYAGNFNAVRTGGGGAKVSILAKALARIKGQTVEAMQALVDKMTKEQVAEYKSKAKVAKAIVDIRAEEAAERAARAAKKAAETTDGEAESDEDIDLGEFETTEEA